MKNTIDNFIFKLDFSNEIDELKNSIPSNIFEKIKLYFPISTVKSFVETEITMSNNSVSKQDTPKKQWEYVNNENDRKIIITSNSISFSSKNYKSFDDVTKMFYDVVEETLKCNNIQIARIGIRYVNLFKSKDYDIDNLDSWKKYISNELISCFDFGEGKYIDNISNMVNSTYLNFGTYNINFKFGINNQKFPLKNPKSNFVIDIDGFSNVLVDDYKDFKDIVNEIHQKIEEVYFDSITEDLQNFLNE